MHRLLDAKAKAFEGLDSGGEFGLACTEAHVAFKSMYEAKVDAELEANGSSREALVAFLDGNEENEGVYYLLDMLLSLDDFEHFVDLMVRRRDGKRVTLPVNLRDAQDVTDLIFGCEELEDDEEEDQREGEEEGRERE